MRSRTGALVLLLAALLLVGCGYRGASGLPLPGGVGKGGYRVTMVFDDVSNLVPQETCRASDVVVGTVESVELRPDLKATVVCRIERSVTLAGNAVATLRETSLLGERFVALDPPPGEQARGRLAEGAALPEAASHVVPNVEVVFGALSQVLNGGGLANLETISRELSVALSGSDLGGTTDQLGKLVGTLNANRGGIVAALDAVDRLSRALAEQRAVIGTALDSVPDGLAALERQRPKLIRTLTALGDLADVAVPLIRQTKADTVADLRLLGPVLEDLAKSKKLLARALEAIVTFPFPSYTKYVAQGDYAGMFATFSLDIDSLNKLLAANPPALPVSAPGSAIPLPALPKLPALPLKDLLALLPSLHLPGGSALMGQGPQRVGSGSVAEPPRTLAELLTGGAS